MDNHSTPSLEALIARLDAFLPFSKRNSEKVQPVIRDYTTQVEAICSNSVNNALKYYQLTEALATQYYLLRENNHTQPFAQALYSSFKTEITNSDHHLWQLSQEMNREPI
jgi:hypothetical protein